MNILDLSEFPLTIKQLTLVKEWLNRFPEKQKPLLITGVREALSQDSQNKLNAIYPPIDRVLATGLNNSRDADILSHSDIWKLVLRKGWSSLESAEYESVITAIAQVARGELWKIENYWQGYQ